MRSLFLKNKNEIRKGKKKKGFTLIELIIVIAIIAILAAMAIPKMGEIRESANKKADLATAKNIATIISTKVSQNEEINSSGVVSTSITDQLDGKTKPQVSAHKNDTFSYSIDEKGNITISYTTGNEKVYPQP